MRRQERKHAARHQEMTRYRLRIQQLTLIIRSPLHTTIIPNNQHQPAEPLWSNPGYSASSSVAHRNPVVNTTPVGAVASR